MKKILLIFPAGLFLILLVKSVMKPKLKNFTPSEFGIWYPLMSTDLLRKLDRLRDELGAPIVISSAEGGIGREDDSGSQHNFSKWGEVRAIDYFPKTFDQRLNAGRGGYRYRNSIVEMQEVYDAAKKVGFTGIGVYIDTVPGYMMHSDVRPTEKVWVRTAANQYNYNALGLSRVGLVA